MRSGETRSGVITACEAMGQKPYSRSPTAMPSCVDSVTVAKPRTGTMPQPSSPLGKKRQ